LAETDLEAQARVAAFRDQLAELGWVDSNKIKFEFRFFGSDPNAGKAFATELINLAPPRSMQSGRQPALFRLCSLTWRTLLVAVTSRAYLGRAAILPVSLILNSPSEVSGSRH